jgi:hypothetical protein
VENRSTAKGSDSGVLASVDRKNRPNLTQRLRSGPTVGPRQANWKALAIGLGVLTAVILLVFALKGGN